MEATITRLGNDLSAKDRAGMTAWRDAEASMKAAAVELKAGQAVYRHGTEWKVGPSETAKAPVPKFVVATQATRDAARTQPRTQANPTQVKQTAARQEQLRQQANVNQRVTKGLKP